MALWIRSHKLEIERGRYNKKYLKKKIFGEVTEDIVDMSIVRIFKKLRRKKWEYVSTFLMSFLS